ncbi:putative phospholipase carboxylesterase superfamily protein [Neofusicoccum parvum UCRNP2]|uniref:Phospholipase carboxylesterase superfamily protein n=2 Tax=Neofusicoccum parvum TaxID=310453 RepID=A0ACB5SBD1_9PEZI|nr:putative phospholipase carboxylesterase superfamily protein [Neofusicoccum parvum UCRNP2]GME33483.1 putative phospholipase carboxylesterase superfamily protein [Neofusicoccum parvum]
MPKRLPTAQDFPSTITLSISPPPASQPPTNVLVLLHGLGDTHASFAALGRQMNLPETVCIAVRAPAPLPFDLGGFHWGDDMLFDQTTGEMDVDTGFGTATRLLLGDVIRRGLLDACGYRPRELVLFGFGQGGMAALQVAAELGNTEELGGVVSIGGALPAAAPRMPVDKKCRSPVLLCKAARGSAVSDAAVARLKDDFEFVEVNEWRRVGDGMPSNRDEMLPIMQFFARRLRSVKGVPQGAVELS